MAYLVRRPGGRFEIRQSHATPRGPRARTLATFRELSPALLDKAEQRAGRTLDRDALRRRAVALRVPWRGTDAVSLARALLTDLASGRTLPPMLSAALAQRLDTQGRELPDSIPPVLDWLGASDGKRGEALRDLLRLASLLPQGARADEPLAFPALRHGI